MTCACPSSTRTTSAISVCPVSRAGRPNNRGCPAQAAGGARLAAVDPWTLWPHPTLRRGQDAGLQSPVSRRPFADGQQADGRVLTSFRKGGPSQGRTLAAKAAPAEAGGERASSDSGWDESRRAPGPTHSQGAFTSEDDVRNRFRNSGQVVFRSRPSRLPCWCSTPSGFPFLPREDPRPKRWVVVADITMVG